MLPTREKILERLHRCIRRGETVATTPRLIGRINEAFVQGDQWSTFTRKQTVDDAWFDDEGVPRIYVNECQGLMTTWSALLNRDRKSAVADPASESPEDIYTAEVTNRFIDFFASEEETATKTHRAVQSAFENGTAGLKVWFDKASNRVRWETLTIHTFLIDPVEDWRDAQWVIFENYYTEDEVTNLWQKNKLKTSPPEETEYTNTNGERLWGVRGLEVWHRPCREFPRGFYACVIGNTVVERMAYPNVVKTDAGDEYLLPLSLMKVRFVRGSAYGKTPMTDVVPLQRSLNEMVARIMKLVRIVTNPHLKLPQKLADSFDPSTTNLIGMPKGDDTAKDIGWTQPGEIHPALFTQRDYFVTAMNEVVGLNDVTVGTENRSISGRSRELIYQLDAQKNADALKSLDDMVLDAWRLTLALVQLHYTDERLAALTETDAGGVMLFRGADIQGKNIRLQASSELDKRTDARVQGELEKLQQGVATPADVSRAARTPAFGAAKRQARAFVADFLAGADVDADMRLYDPAVLGDVIEREKVAAIREGRRADFRDLVYLQRFLGEQAAAEDAAPKPERDAAAPEPAPTLPEVQ